MGGAGGPDGGDDRPACTKTMYLNGGDGSVWQVGSKELGALKGNGGLAAPLSAGSGDRALNGLTLPVALLWPPARQLQLHLVALYAAELWAPRHTGSGRVFDSVDLWLPDVRCKPQDPSD
eukprot:scaffold19951_cov22-Tisochrysis_lutea.AAC.1